MSLDLLLGNEQLKAKLAPALQADRLSHAYILSGPVGSGRRTLATILAAAMECTAGSSRPCGVCAQCRKVFSGTHPDVITVDDDKHKGVSVEVVRQARSDVFIRPNEGRRKVYFFPRAADMNAAGQNALLKVIEEPPSYAAFLLLTDGAQKLLPTIRSRSVELQLAPLPKAVCLARLRQDFRNETDAALEAAFLRSGGYYGQAKALLSDGCRWLPQTVRFAEVYAERNALGLCELLVPMERLGREQLQGILTEWLTLLSDALSVRAGAPPASEEASRIGQSRTGAELLDSVRHLQKALALLQANVATGTLCGALQVYLR